MKPDTRCHQAGKFAIPWLIAAACLLAILGSTSQAALGGTIHLPRDLKSIQSAIDVAKPGDVVLVGSGTYKERIAMKPGVTLRSAGDDRKGKIGLKRAETTIIDRNIKRAKGPGIAMARRRIRRCEMEEANRQ